jgi:hypothetical protein
LTNPSKNFKTSQQLILITTVNVRQFPSHLVAHHITAPETWNSSWELLHLIIKDIVTNAKWRVPITVGELNKETDEAQQVEADKKIK